VDVEVPTERGAGLIATFSGLLVVLVLLLFAVEVLVGLYAGTALTGATHAAARQVASDPRVRSGADPAGAVQEAEAELRDALGGTGGATEVRWSVDADQVVVQARQQRPGFLPVSWRTTDPRWIDRTVRVRVEALR
jgi:Flp pilus assembly protein TadG